MAGRRKPPDRYHHGNLRAALLSAAWSIVSRHGVEGLSLRALAEALGVSHAAPAWHFKDKAALLAALRVSAWTRFAEALEAGASEGLRGVGRAYLDFAAEHPRQIELMFRAGSGPPPPEELEAGMRAWQLLSTAVTGVVGPRRAADPASLPPLAMAAWAMVHGLAALERDVVLPFDAGDAAGRAALRERVLDVVVAGIERVVAPPARR